MKLTQLLLLCAVTLGPVALPTVYAQKTIRLSNKQTKQVPLDWMLDDDKIWAVTPDEFETKAGHNKFVWQDKERTRARFNPEDHEFNLHGTKVGETLVSFKAGKVSSITFSVLNKGDDYELGKNEYNEAMNAMKTILKEASKIKEEARPRNEAVTRAESTLWRSPRGLYLLEGLFLEETTETEDGWRTTYPAHAEFVRVRLLPPQMMLGTGVPAAKTNVSAALLQTRAKREGTRVLIDTVPMVDQGQKGYCGVATFERVLRYYGADIDMHDLANLANTYGGTNPKGMKDAVKKIATKLGMTTREPFSLADVRSYLKLIKEYNIAAKHAKMAEVQATWSFWEKMDSNFLKSLRVKSPDYLKFKQEIVANINKGVPVMWALHLGMYWEDKIEESFEANRYASSKTGLTEEDTEDAKFAEEIAKDRAEEIEDLRKKSKRPPSYMQGGHMRLIIGYDSKENVIFYTDSWGPGHELKKMNIDEAFTGTMALMILEPR